MIVHDPILKIKTITDYFSTREGVAVKYVGTTALGSEAFAADVFYRSTPHPEYGNKYFGLIYRGEDLMIFNADVIEDLVFQMIEADNGDLHFSAHRHDYKMIDGKMIDGGRAYTKSNCHTIPYVVRNGEYVPKNSS